MTNVSAKRVHDLDKPRTIPGAFEYFGDENNEGPVGLTYVCPCGCGRVGGLDFRPAPSPSWEWDGNLESPTLSPSVHHIIEGVTHWHGYLRNGIWEPC